MTSTHRQIDTRRSSKTVAALVASIFSAGTEGRSRPARAKNIFYSRYAHSLYTSIHKGYLQKAAYGSDELGERWPPIKPSTIAARPITRADMQRYQIHPNRKRGLLTPREDRIWRMIFKAKFNEMFGDRTMSHDEAKARAAKAAWWWLKNMGARTKKQVLANRPVRMLIATGRLERSFRPGRVTRFSYVPYNKDQIYEVSSQRLKIGTRVPYAKHHQYGTKNHPARPPIPSAQSMRRWSLRAAREGMQAVRDYLAEEVI